MGPSAAAVGIDEIAYVANICAWKRCRTGWSRCSTSPRPISPWIDTGGLFAYGTHAAVVAVEPGTGVVEILDFAVAEDCGTMINPMIVDGQVRAASRRASAPRFTKKSPMTSRASRSPARSPITSCPVPRRCRRSRSRICIRPRRTTEYGVKGMGEGGAIAPPAAIANAVRDALARLGAEV